MISTIKILKIFIITLYLTYLFSIANSVDHYSKEEQDALEKFRPLVQNILYRDYMKEDHFLVRWLRARDLDISRARTMLEKAIRWRKENKMDSILNETILTFPVPPYYHDSFAYSGNPVSTINIRVFEIKKYILAGKRAEFLRFMDQILEIGEAGVQYSGKRFPQVRQVISIFDLTEYNQRQQGCLSCVLIFQEWLRHYENYYPQLVKYLFIVNAPRIVKPLLNAVKPLYSPQTRKGLMIFGQNKKEWSRAIYKLVPRNQLRRGLGGTKPDHVPCAPQDFVCICKLFLKFAGKGTNTTLTLSSGLQKLDVDIC